MRNWLLLTIFLFSSQLTLAKDENFPTGVFRILAEPLMWKDANDHWQTEPKSQRDMNVLMIEKLPPRPSSAEPNEYFVRLIYTIASVRSNTCVFAGVFVEKDGHLRLSDRYNQLQCKVKITQHKNQLIFSDPQDTCESFCAGASWDGINFPLSSLIREYK